MKVEIISPVETYEIRHTVLRSGFPRCSVHYEQDLTEGAFHLGVFEQDTLICIGSFYKTPKLNSFIRELIEKDLHRNQVPPNEIIYQLRGMATLPEFRNLGAGSLLIYTAKKILQTQKADILWCNARQVAFSFYRRLGLKEVGEFFNTYSVPHKVMYKQLE